MPRNTTALTFDLSHEGILSGNVVPSIITLTPAPKLLRGEREALLFYRQAQPIRAVAAERARTGTVIMAPTANSLIRQGTSVDMYVDTQQGAQVALFVNGKPVSAKKLADRTVDPNLQREAFHYIGVKLRRGKNVLRAEGTMDGNTTQDEINVYVSDVPKTLALEPRSTLVADTATPLFFDIIVKDKNGKAPIDGSVTFTAKGASFIGSGGTTVSTAKVNYTDGRAVLMLAPVANPGEVIINASLGEKTFETKAFVRSYLRPWIASALGSLQANFDGASSPSFGVSAYGNVFARGSIGSYLLTVAAESESDVFGLNRDPFDPFVATGTIGDVNVETPSRHGVFARVERDLSYLQYGDFTAAFKGYLLAGEESYTGLSARIAPLNTGFTATAYGALAPSGDKIENLELPSDGTSFYRLPNAPVRSGSLQLEVIKRSGFDNSLILQDAKDPRVRTLVPLVDYALDESTGIIQLVNPLPLRDAQGNRYILRASYSVVQLARGEPVPQFGVQLEQSLGDVTLRLAGKHRTLHQKNYLDQGTAGVYADKVFASREGRLQGGVEVSYGQIVNQDIYAGGVALATSIKYQEPNLTTDFKYRFYTAGFRSEEIEEASPSHSASLSSTYHFSPNFQTSFEGQVTFRYDVPAEDQVRYYAKVLNSYMPDYWLYLGDVAFAQPSLGFGLELKDATVGALAGIGLHNIQSLGGGEITVLHHQALPTGEGVTDFGISYKLTEYTSFKLTDSLTWGHGNELFAGLSSAIPNKELMHMFCTDNCDKLSGDDLGSTILTAEYQIPERATSEVNRMRFGVDADYPLTDYLGVEASVEQDWELQRSQTTVVGAGLNYTSENADANFRYEVNVSGPNVKNTLSAGTSFALSNDLFGSLSATYLSSNFEDPSTGLLLNASGAYRTANFALLTTHSAKTGLLVEKGITSEFYGDTVGALGIRRDVTRPLDVRFGYTYDFRPSYGLLDRTSLGVGMDAWQGGSVLAFAGIYHDWPQQHFMPGLTLEVSQFVGCGLYGVLGYNFIDEGFAKTTAQGSANYFGKPGIYVRLDAVVDEAWRCEQLGIKR